VCERTAGVTWELLLGAGAWPLAPAAQGSGQKEAEARMAYLLERLQSRDASAKKYKACCC
jgi:hypothetical protein